MATRAASFVLCILLLAMCSGAAKAEGEFPVDASATPYCGRTFIANPGKGKCDDTQCWSLCHDKYFRLTKVVHTGGACETPKCCLCEVDCE
ncbi:hypothetical protein BAE44_0011273 [Dichanthelium oligosanthes]|uniref:Knottin scorpion toxin-like domain-containing protein n=1 Tax=Dichanthelium oligosanthes TaxID=888268 RepID=A0A1E5VRH0_9POAL|nr:hypothetical protein BAE44_0011273 [Dichanthelium oligosanthes]